MTVRHLITNEIPSPPQAQFKHNFSLATAAAALAVFDGLRDKTTLPGSAAGVTTIATALTAGSLHSTIDVVDASFFATMAWPGMDLWLYNPTSYEYQHIFISAATTGVPETLNFHLPWRAEASFPVGSIVSMTPPFHDVFMLDLAGKVSSAVLLAVVFSNADPVAYGLTMANLASFAALHVELFPVTPVITEIQERDIVIPRSACPARYISLLADANLDGSLGGSSDTPALALHRLFMPSNMDASYFMDSL